MKSLLQFDLKNILLILLIGVVVFQQCGKGKEKVGEIINVGGKDYELLEHRIDTVYEEKIVEVPTYIPKYVERLVEVPVEIPIDVDTLKIIEEYFSSFKVTDTLHLTYKFSKDVLDENGNKPKASLGYGVIADVISQNKIQSRDIKWNFQIPTIYDTKIVKELPKNQVYMGLNTNFDRVNVINSVGAGMILKTKRDRLYQLNTGLSNSITGETQPYLGGGMYWKIKLRK
jgi:hypothetical protein